MLELAVGIGLLLVIVGVIALFALTPLWKITLWPSIVAFGGSCLYALGFAILHNTDEEAISMTFVYVLIISMFTLIGSLIGWIEHDA